MSELAPSDDQGNYIRPTSSLTNSPEKEAITEIMRSFSKADQSYSLFVGLACQWCHRVMLARVLCKRQNEVELQYLQPGVDGLWLLQEPNNAYGKKLKDVYLSLDKKYSGRFTAPLLVDNVTESISSNESAHILRIFATETPVQLTDDILVWLRPSRDNVHGIDVDALDALCTRLYETVNDGVYRVGFATSQGAYENALRLLFETLDAVENMLSRSRFLFSHNVITEADIRLFPTVFRFDAIYAVLFKATLKSIRADYPAIAAWMRGMSPPFFRSLPFYQLSFLTSLLAFYVADMYNLPGVSTTCDLDATRHNYYSSLFPLNPSAIVPVAPLHDLSCVPERQGLGKPATAP